MKKLSIIFLLSFSSFIYAQTKNQLVVVTENAPPLQYLKNDRVSGITTDIVKEVLLHANIQADIQIFPWSRAYQYALSEPNTLIYSLARTPDRENQFIWIGKILTMQLSFVKLTHRDDVKIGKLKAVKQLKLGAMRDDISHKYLEKNGFESEKDFLLTPDIPQLLKLLYAEKIDTFIADVTLLKATALLQGYEENKLMAAYALPEQDFSLYLGANKHTSPHLISKLKNSLQVVLSKKHMNNMPN